mgnify:CR=1 FL=1
MMVTGHSACFLEFIALCNQSENLLLFAVDILSNFRNLFRTALRHDNNARVVTDDDVTRANLNIGERNGNVHCINIYAVLTGTHIIAFREYRVPALKNRRDIAADPINDRTGNAVFLGGLCHDVTPDGAIVATRVVNDDDLPRLDVIQEVTDRALDSAAGGIVNSESPTADFFSALNRLDAVNAASIPILSIASETQVVSNFLKRSII